MRKGDADTLVFLKTIKLNRRFFIVSAAIIFLLYGMYHLAFDIIERRAVESMSWALANKIVVIDPGHGGPDGGGTGQSGIQEKEITLSFAKNLAERFSQAGSAIILTRDKDKDLTSEGGSISSRKKEDLRKRVEIANQNEADIYISIHTNCFGSKWKGAQTFYYPENEDSKRLGESIQSEIRDIMKNTDREALPLDSNYVLKNLNMPAVIVEVGFLSNPEEEKMLLDTEYKKKMSYAVYSGAVKYFVDEDDF